MMRFLRALPLVLLFALSVAVHPASAAGNGLVSVVPGSSNVVVGGTVNVDMVIEPPSSELAIWIVKVAYDPDVVQVNGCTPLNVSAMPDMVGAAGCDTIDTNADAIDDTAVAFGGGVENIGGTPHGFTSTQTVATFTFQAIGIPGQQSPLNLSVIGMLGPNGEQITPDLSNGTIHIVNASPSPTVAPVGGAVELLSGTDAGASTFAESRFAAVLLAVTAVGSIAFVASRRIIRR